MDRERCHDCGVLEGGLHKEGCDMEKCPICGGQLITDDCAHEMAGYKVDYRLPHMGLPERVYNSGLTAEEKAPWEAEMQRLGRVPYIQWPNVCCRCGDLYPEMFHVTDEEWKRYVEPRKRGKMLCRSCYDYIKDCIDNPLGEEAGND